MVVSVVMREAEVVDSPADLRLLDAGERVRAERKRASAPFVTGHALVRRALGELLDLDPADLSFERSCATCGSERHGKPSLAGIPGWSFSLSYTSALAVVAIAEGVEVGVDVEDLTDADFEGFTEVTLARDEADAFVGLHGRDLLNARARVWARKEAVLKATGYGLVVDPSEVLVTGPFDPPGLAAWRAAAAQPDAVSIVDLRLAAPNHRAAVAGLTHEPLEILTDQR